MKIDSEKWKKKIAHTVKVVCEKSVCTTENDDFIRCFVECENLINVGID